MIVEQAGEDISTKNETTPKIHVPITLLRNIRLGQKAFLSLLPTAHTPWIPAIHQREPIRPGTDPNVAAVDALLGELTGGLSPSELPMEQILEPDMVEPVLKAARELVNQMGKTQVELAASAIAVARIRPRCSVLSIIKHADRALRELARNVVRNGDTLHRSIGAPTVVLGDLPREAVDQIRASSDAYKSLRAWSLNAMSEALQQ
jgi:hypothetical protein